MRILVDADAMPVALREILFRAADRTGIPLVLVANVPLKHPASALITSVVAPAGPDEADDAIADMARPGDIVITADIPLAARSVEKGARVIDPRGQEYSPDNIQERLVMRNLMADLREGGVDTGGPGRLTARDVREFAGTLERLLAGRGGVR